MEILLTKIYIAYFIEQLILNKFFQVKSYLVKTI